MLSDSYHLGYAIDVIDSNHKEGAYDKGQDMLLIWAVLKSILSWIQSKQSEKQQSTFASIFHLI